MGPWYAGDGKGEDGLSQTYSSSDGKTIIAVTDFFQSLNKTNPGPCVLPLDLSKISNERIDMNIGLGSSVPTLGKAS